MPYIDHQGTKWCRITLPMGHRDPCPEYERLQTIANRTLRDEDFDAAEQHFYLCEKGGEGASYNDEAEDEAEDCSEEE